MKIQLIKTSRLHEKGTIHVYNIEVDNRHIEGSTFIDYNNKVRGLKKAEEFFERVCKFEGKTEKVTIIKEITIPDEN